MTLHDSGIALAVLGAGLGTRFGPEDKLAAHLNGQPVAHHLLKTVTDLVWTEKIVVCRDMPDWVHAYEAEGFTVASLTAATQGLRGSLLAASAKVTAGDRLLVCLADMPCVTASHLRHLLAEARNWPGVIASASDGYLGPPAIIPVREIEQLSPDGDTGARALLSSARLVAALPDELVDIDTREDLARLERSLTETGG